jgi:phosphonate transport system substrate-binding protein
MTKYGWIYCFLFTLVLASCSHEREAVAPQYGSAPKESGSPVYSFAIHPLHNPNELMREYQPLIEYLNARITGAKLVLEASRDYASFEEKYKARKPEFILPNPWQTLQAMRAGYHVVATAGDSRDFKGIFIVRKDSGIKRPADLKGKAVSYPAATALAACIMPQYFLHKKGIDVNVDIQNRYVGSQESSIMNAYLKNTAAGATWPPPWRAFQKLHPEEAAELTVAWETESLINNSVMIRSDIPAPLQKQVRELLARLNETEQGRAILGNMETARFIPASDKDYDVVRMYVERFEREVRKVEMK